MTQKFTLKRDSYREARGGYARFLNLYCARCGAHVLLYQKDGPGVLYRLYLDRIFAPQELTNLQDADEVSHVPNLTCRSCGALLGTPYIWEEENRKAFLLKDGSVVKKIGKGVYPPDEATAR